MIVFLLQVYKQFSLYWNIVWHLFQLYMIRKFICVTLLKQYNR